MFGVGYADAPTEVEALIVNPPQPRVLQVISQLGLGGAEAVSLDILRGLPRQQVAGVFVVMSGVNDAIGHAWQRELMDDSVPLVMGTRMPLKAGGLPAASVRFARAISELRPDIVHLHTEIPEATHALAMAFDWRLARRVRVVRTIHNSTLWPKWRGLAFWSERALTNVAVAAVSEDAMTGLAQLRNSLKLPPIDSALARVIHNGREIPEQSELRRVDDGRLKVLFAGRFEAQKGADLLEDVFNALEEWAACRVDLTIAGSGALRGQLRHSFERMPHLGSSKVIEPIPDLARTLAEYDIVIMPSRFEGFGLLAVEAELANVTLVATRAPGLDEVLPPDHPWVAAPGDPVSFADALTLAIKHQDRWKAVNAAAYEFAVARFGLGKMQSAYLRFYQDLA
jgi:glycosyltransferase involved in cell wall biosynthesis